MDQQLVSLSDEALVARAHSLAADVRRSTAELVAVLAEVDGRRLHLAEGHATFFDYCRDALRMSEGEAGNRIAVARAAQRFPVILGLLRGGDVNLTTVRLLAPHLTDANHADLLAEACGKTRPQVEVMLARLAPRPAVASSLRRVAAPTAQTLSSAIMQPREAQPPAALPAVSAPARAAVVLPLAPELYRLTTTMDTATRDAWQRARELITGDDAAVLARLLSLALPLLERKKYGRTPAPRPGRATGPHSRHVPADVKRAVDTRDGGQCAFVGRSGTRCGQRRRLEFHHVKPWMAGGATTPDNIELRCRADNQHEAHRFFAASREARTGPPSAAP
jgi:hypothetical protein